ncbi:unnamed protein product, partial [Ectocarpus sp. 12 AP-2014]
PRGSTSFNIWRVSEANPQASLGVLGFLEPTRPRQRVNLSKTWLLMYSIHDTAKTKTDGHTREIAAPVTISSGDLHTQPFIKYASAGGRQGMIWVHPRVRR